MKIWNYNDGGRALEIHTPDTPSTWANFLFNDSYHTEVSQTLQGLSSMVDSYNQTHYTKGSRYFYINNHKTGEVFCPTTQPYRSEPDSYICKHGLYFSELTSEKNGMRFSAKIFVPTEKPCEIWEISLTNHTDTEADFSVFSGVQFANDGPMGGECRYCEDNYIYKYSVPYHVFYDEYEKVKDKKAYYFMYSDTEIASYDCSIQRFFGCANRNMLPAAVKNGACSNIDFEGDSDYFLAAMEHRFTLTPGETKSFYIVLGTASNRQEIKDFVSGLDIEEEWKNLEDKWLGYENALMIRTPDETLDAMVNFWVKKQAIYLTRLNRKSTYCPVRNQLQDALGYAMIEPYEALEFALKVLRRQQYDGFLKQWYMTDGSPDVKLCLIKHSDAPVWLIICLTAIINLCEDASIYDRSEGYIDSSEKESVYMHLVKAAKYLGKAVGEHGLCLMLDGDWTDPINGAGRLGKGESTWLSMATVYAIDSLLEVCKYKSDEETYKELSTIKQSLADAINTHCYLDGQYICGFDDNGIPFGKKGDSEGETFLNAQTWALISRVAEDERKQSAIKAIDSLETDFGSLLLKPEFRSWNSTWGRISIKQAGTTENGSVYCHASMFKAYSDCVLNNGDRAYNTIAKTLPTNPKNPPEHNLQCPTFIPNYYFGLKDSPNCGISSCNYGTGSAAWFLWVVVNHILGFNRTITGTHINPSLPKAWDECRVWVNSNEYLIKENSQE